MIKGEYFVKVKCYICDKEGVFPDLSNESTDDTISKDHYIRSSGWAPLPRSFRGMYGEDLEEVICENCFSSIKNYIDEMISKTKKRRLNMPDLE